MKNWNFYFQSCEDRQYMVPLFSFVFKFFEEIFGENAMAAEPCILYNDRNAACPMLITNSEPIRIRTNAKNLLYWSQFIFHLSHEMTHYVIRQYKPDKSVIIKWFEETICEAMSLYILCISGKRWAECELYSINPHYGQALDRYWRDKYLHTEQSVLSQCHTLSALELLENTCETNRDGRSIERNYLFDAFSKFPKSIADFVYYPLYMRGDLQVDFKSWESKQENNLLIPHLKSIHPKIEV